MNFFHDASWVFKSFGFLPGIQFVLNGAWVNLKRLFVKETEQKFEDLTDEEAQACAWAFGIFKWEDREDLNRQWKLFEESLAKRY